MSGEVVCKPSNVELHMKRIKLQFESCALDDLNPVGQTQLRQTSNFSYERKSLSLVGLVKFDVSPGP